MTSDSEAKSTIRDVTQLLIAHADLIEDTSEKMALELSQAITAFKSLVAKNGLAGQRDVRAELEKMLSALQFQDILRQQIEPVRHGLKAIQHATPPDEESVEAWREKTMSDVRSCYVMHSQFEADKKATGETTSKEPAVSGKTFFF